MTKTKLLALALAACGLIACGGGDGVNCSFAACGGDPVGTWNIDGACFDVGPLVQDIQDACPEARVNISIAFGGTVVIDSDNTYSAETTVVQNSSIVVPGSCLEGATSCDQLDSDTLQCSGDISSQCSCRIMDTMMNTDAGTWSVNGNEITLGSDEPALYCQERNLLKIQTIPVDPEDSVTTLVLSRE